MTSLEMTDQEIEEQVLSEINHAKSFVQKLRVDEVQSGEWFIRLLQTVVYTYQHNARADYFRQKYPGLTDDELADKLIAVSVRYAAIAGAVTGVVTSANQMTALVSGGMTTALVVSSIGAEMIYLTRIQMRLILDLAVIYDLQLDPEDPEDVLMIFGYALGIAPSDLVGKGLQIGAAAGTRTAIRKYISKGTLKSIQDYARRLGFKLLQRTILKYAVPAVSAAVGSSYNYTSTLAVGQIARTHFRSRGKVTEELRQLISRQNVYELVYPAAILYVASVDGEYNERERELYQAILSRMCFDAHTQEQFQQLQSSEEHLLESFSQITEDENAARTLLDLLILIAVYDGELVEAEEVFLIKAAERLRVPIDIEAIRECAADYQINYRSSVWQRVASKTEVTLAGMRRASDNTRRIVTQTVQHKRRKFFRLNNNDDLEDTAESP